MSTDIDNGDITVVVQGPVQSLPDRPQDEGITARCLASVRRFLPGAQVILSTWPDQPLEGLDYDALVINEDPGPNVIGYGRDGAPRKENTNRQIVSTMGGLERVRTPYAMKLRADNFLTGDGFKALQRRFTARCDEYRYLRERVVITNTLMRRYYRGRRVAFFLSDFFDFGRTGDVVDLWDLPLLEDYRFDPALLGALQHHGAPERTVDVDQVLAERFINKHRAQPLDLRHVFDTRDDLLRESDLFFANNFVVATAEEIGLGLPSKFVTGRQAKFSSKATCLSRPEWERLYRKHCDPSHRPGQFWQHMRVQLMRAGFVPLKRLEQAGRAVRDRREFERARARNGG